MAAVEFRNVSKRFAAGTEAVRNLNLAIDDGELVVLVGPSGCGKSTVLRLLAGLEEPNAGEILLDGKVVNRISPRQRNIAMVFQNYALYPHMTVRDNLAFPLRMRRTPRETVARKIADIAGILDLRELLDRRPGQLSGGQKQRVAMGRALVRNPSVFLLDEPLSNLDAKLRAQIRADISSLQKRLARTTLYVTHDQVEAMTLGDRIAVMERGELHQVGTPAELYRRPRSIFVARFIGNPGMNIFSASVLRDKDGTWRLRTGNWDIPLPPEKLPRGGSPEALRSIRAGLRPESFGSAPEEGTVPCAVRATATEFLGHETLVYFHIPGAQVATPLAARLPGHMTLPEPAAELHIHPSALYLFGGDGILLQ
ncbi:MAG: ATP-binding cassette domain-containing protein [Desulfobulbaceae bacterium]|nr:ATP-binding cassette domain-containing protein [Desulfobulbaceae bacterium]